MLPHKKGCGCPSCYCPDSDVVMYGNGFGLGITTDQSGQSWLGGKKIVGWQDDMPLTFDPKTGQLFANILNMTTGQYMPGVAMPTTITARHGGWGPIATAPTGSGRTFWAEDDVAAQNRERMLKTLPYWLTGMALGAWGCYNFMAMTGNFAYKDKKCYPYPLFRKLMKMD